MSKIRFDPRKTFPLDEFDCYKHIAVFDEHPAIGTRKPVNKELLDELAKNCNEKFSKVGAAVPLTLGHTKDDAKEEDQPDVVGWAVNFDVEPLFDTGREALYADLYVRKKFRNVIDEYPHRSVELWRTKKDISPIALLKTTPERDLPIIKYAAESTDDDPSTYYFSTPETKEKLMMDATMAETSGFKELSAKIDNLVGMFQEFIQMLQEEEGGGGGEGDMGKEDLLAAPEDKKPDEKPVDKKEEKKPDEVPDEKNAKAENTMPEKCAATAAPSATNCFIPSKEKEKMSRDNAAEVEKFNRHIQSEVEKAVRTSTEKLERENAELRQHYKRTEAEKLVKELEDKHNIDFGDEKARIAEVELFAALNKESVSVHYDRVKSRYQKKPDKTPDSASVNEVLRYGRLPENLTKEQMGDPVKAQELAEEILASGLGYKEFMREQAKTKTK